MTPFPDTLTSAKIPLFLLSLLWTKYVSYIMQLLQNSSAFCAPHHSEIFQVWIGFLGQITLTLSDWWSQWRVVESSHSFPPSETHSGESWETMFCPVSQTIPPRLSSEHLKFLPVRFRDVPSKYRHAFDWERWHNCELICSFSSSLRDFHCASCGLNMKLPSTASCVEHLVPSWSYHFERLRKLF